MTETTETQWKRCANQHTQPTQRHWRCSARKGFQSNTFLLGKFLILLKSVFTSHGWLISFCASSSFNLFVHFTSQFLFFPFGDISHLSGWAVAMSFEVVATSLHVIWDHGRPQGAKRAFALPPGNLD